MLLCFVVCCCIISWHEWLTNFLGHPHTGAWLWGQIHSFIISYKWQSVSLFFDKGSNIANIHWSYDITVIQWITSCHYPHAFLKKCRGYCNRLRPSVFLSVCLSVTLSPPKPFDEIQPNLVCELLTWMRCATANFFFAPPPGALGRGQKVKYH